MFKEIFGFEIRYRLRRPAVYIYFLLVLIFSAFSIAKGDVPRGEKEWIDSPVVLSQFSAIMSVFLMIASASIMGMAIYRDLEYGTKEYYLSYPITKPGYFWGRFLGSFVFVAAIGAATMIGAWLGTRLGPAFHWQSKDNYGNFGLARYCYPYLTLTLPSLFFTSSFFFGLVSAFRNVKVIYSSGTLLFLGYMISSFFLHNSHNQYVIYLTDPFNFNGLRAEVAAWSPDQHNHSLVRMQGLLLQNRIVWTSVALAGLAITWFRFSFERFFSGRQQRRLTSTLNPARPQPPRHPYINLKGSRYNQKSLYTLTRIEIVNIVRDSYFWIILSGGLIFMFFIFWMGPGRYGVPDYPRTSFFMGVFMETFPFFLFLIIIFYTGETVHREKHTRYHLINDTLPPPTWVFNTAKLLSLLALAIGLALVPMLIGIAVQLLKGYPHLNLTQYASSELVALLPKMIATVLFCYATHIAIDNKFAAHGVAITVWTVLYALTSLNYFDYHLLLYSYTPQFWPSDIDGIGHMVRPVLWYQAYWTVAGLLLVLIGSLFYARGTRTTIREKTVLARQRFRGWTSAGIITATLLFLNIGGYIYYDVSYLNEYLTNWEKEERAALTERQLRRYADIPQPRTTHISMQLDLYPDIQQETTKALVTLANKTNQTIDSLLVDGDGLDFEVYSNTTKLPYTCPLYFPRGRFDFFRPKKEPSDYRWYRLDNPLKPGDSIQLEVRSTIAHEGFENSLYNANTLHNILFTGGNLPGLGYDKGDELGRADIRREHGLPKKDPDELTHDNPNLVPLDITVSTSSAHVALVPGHLEKEWTANDRHYYRYTQNDPGIYAPFGILSARYKTTTSTVTLSDGRPLEVSIFYTPMNNLNLADFQSALKDGLEYYSRSFGPYPFSRLTLMETPVYGPFNVAMQGEIGLIENLGGWNADLRGNNKTDYPYYNTAIVLAQQWWGQQVAPNNAKSSPVISKGLAVYSALRLLRQYRGKDAVSPFLEDLQRTYGWGHRTDFDGEHDLLHANKPHLWDAKTPLVLYNLAEYIGADSINAALRDFLQQWKFRRDTPYAGVADLYSCLKQHIPDSEMSYLKNAWETSMPIAELKLTGSQPKQSASPTKSTTSQTKTNTPPTKPTALTTKPATSQTKPTASQTKSTASQTKSTTPPTKPTTSQTKPTASPTKPATAQTKQPQTKPTTSQTKPTASPTKSTTSQTKTNTPPTKPTTSQTKPTASPTKPATAQTKPTTSQTTTPHKKTSPL